METGFRPFDLERLVLGLQPPLYLLEVALKCVVVFCLLLLVMRLLGKRGQNNLSPMQQMLLIALGSAAGDALLYPTVPLLYAALILVGVTLLTIALEKLSIRSGLVRDQVESHPRLLVAHGVVNEEALDRERTTLRELHAALRINGARSLAQVEYAILEVDGEISVFLNRREPADEDLLHGVLAHDHRHEQRARDAQARTAR
jgi:uncharacterized membrane protein YcaP (DUF421 family)